jgi:hypothetical protein
LNRKRYEKYGRNASWIVKIYGHIFQIISLFNFSFFQIFHIFSLFNLLFKMWKIWKKSKLNSEMIWTIW